MIKRSIHSLFFIVVLCVCSASAYADTYKIGTIKEGGFALLVGVFQQYIDFMTGPFSHMAIASTLIIGPIVWAISPKESIMGTIIRVVVAGIVGLNVATWMNLLGG